MSVIALLGSPNLTMGPGCKTGVSLLIPTMGQGGKTGVSLVGRSGILQRMVSANPEVIGCGLGGLGSGGFGGGRTLLGPDLTSQFLDWHSLIQAFMLVKFSVGMLLAFTWLSLFFSLRSNISGGTNGGSNGTFWSTSVVCRRACSRSLLPMFPWKACKAQGGEPRFSPWPGLHPFSSFFLSTVFVTVVFFLVGC
jgi:hypothetical protein